MPWSPTDQKFWLRLILEWSLTDGWCIIQRTLAKLHRKHAKNTQVFHKYSQEAYEKLHRTLSTMTTQVFYDANLERVHWYWSIRWQSNQFHVEWNCAIIGWSISQVEQFIVESFLQSKYFNFLDHRTVHVVTYFNSWRRKQHNACMNAMAKSLQTKTDLVPLQEKHIRGTLDLTTQNHEQNACTHAIVTECLYSTSTSKLPTVAPSLTMQNYIKDNMYVCNRNCIFI